MYQPGEYVVYGDNGLCLVEQVGVPSFNSDKREYYFLRAADDGSRIYVPLDTHMPLRTPMTAPEAEDFLKNYLICPWRSPHGAIANPYWPTIRKCCAPTPPRRWPR